jgi:uncharacterized protein YraI
MTLRNYLIAGAAAIGMALPSAAAAQDLGIGFTTTDLNLRAGPGTNHGVITSMPRGSQVHIHQCPGNWCQLTYAGTTGWASHRYLSADVAMQPRTFAAAPQPRVTFGVDVGPRRHFAPLPRRHVSPIFPHHHPVGWWRTAHPGWYGDVYYDGRRWWHDDVWYDRPRVGFGITFGN